MGFRRQHRRHQCGADRRQCAGAAAGGAVRILGPHHRPHHLALYARRRHLPPEPQHRVGTDHGAVRPARPVQSAQAQSLVPAARRQGRHQLLRQHAAEADAGRAGGFQAAERRRCAFLGRRGACADRQFRLLRQPQGRNPRRAYPGQRRAAARLSHGARSAPIISGTAASSPTPRCSICWRRTTT